MKLTKRQKELIAQQIVDESLSKLPSVNFLNYDKVKNDLDKIEENLKKLKEDRKTLVKSFRTKILEANPNLEGWESWRDESLPSKNSLKVKGKTSYNIVLDKIELASLDAKDVESLIEKIKNSL